MSTPLTHEEDAELRRLNALTAFGRLGSVVAELYADLRARDRRDSVREPLDLVIPRQRSATDGTIAGRF